MRREGETERCRVKERRRNETKAEEKRREKKEDMQG